MWKCPKCGREFKRENQGHYCGKAPENVNEYIESQNPEARSHLTKLRDIILKNIPNVKERIAWSMPKYEKENLSASFAACKNCVILYLNFEIPEEFKSQLSEFEIRKNSLCIPYGKNIPEELIGEIIKRGFKSE